MQWCGRYHLQVVYNLVHLEVDLEDALGHTLWDAIKFIL